jgi:hypothetical protein
MDEIKIGVFDLQSPEAIDKKIKEVRASDISGEEKGQLLVRLYEHRTRRFPGTAHRQKD